MNYFLILATVITLQWNANPESDINSYLLCRGNISKEYEVVKDVGNVTTVLVDDVDDTKDNFFAVKAKNNNGFLSQPSTEVVIPKITNTVSPTPSSRPTPTPTPTWIFVQAININGNAETINGNLWTSYAAALIGGFSFSGEVYSSSINFTPVTDAATQRMLNKGIWCPTCDIDFTIPIKNGTYIIYLWTIESYKTNFRNFDVLLENKQVATKIGSIPVNTWKRYGPYSIAVNDAALNGRLVKNTGDTVLNGIEIWTSTICACATPCPLR